MKSSLSEEVKFHNTFFADDDDRFHCGKCQTDFTSIHEFIHHKTQHSKLYNDYKKTVKLVDDTRNLPMHILDDDPDIEVNLNSNDIEKLQNSDVKNDICITTDISRDDLTCSLCKRQFRIHLDLLLHLQSHNKELPYQCIVCGKIFTHKSNVKKHIESHKVWPDGLCKTLPDSTLENDTGYSCPYCKDNFTDYLSFKSHITIHKEQKIFKCIQSGCFATYSDLNSLILHIDQIHNYNGKYHCPICSWTSTTLNDVLKHQKNHQKLKSSKNQNIFKCSHCEKVFRNIDNLNHHLDTADHNNRCKYCRKCFVSEKTLRRHLVSHIKNKSFVCDHCGKSFIRKHHLIVHLVTHSNERSYKCVVCNSKFTRKDVLIRHSRIHSNDKKLCPFRLQLKCEAKFTRSDKLKSHIRTHMRRIARLTGKNPSDDVNDASIQSNSTIEVIVIPISKDSSSKT